MRRVLIAGGYKEKNVNASPRFMERVRAVGAVPVIGFAITKSDAEILSEAFDALILTGGADVPPSRYGQAAHISNTYEDPLRDLSDEQLTHAFIKQGKRVMGICRGCQAINVYLGGTLHQHLPDAYDPVIWHGGNIFGRHNIYVDSGTTLAELVGSGVIRVNTSHHQAIDTLAPGLTITAKAPDGVIEAAEGGNILLIQWHPEYMDDEHDALFAWVSGVRE